MKRIISILLLAVTIASSFQLTYGTHYCMGMKRDSGFMLGSHSMGCGMEKMRSHCDQHQSKSNCCEDEYTTVETDDHRLVVLNVTGPLLVVLYTIVHGYLIPSLSALESHLITFYVPPPNIRNIPIIIQSFLI